MSEKKPKPTDASQATLDKAIAKHQAGDTETARALYTELLNTEQEAHGLHLLGVISHQEGNNTKAIELIEQALKVEPGLITGRFNLAKIYLVTGDKEKAFQLFHQCTQLKPDHLEAHHQCGLLLGEYGKFSEAIDSFNAAIALDSSHAASYLQKGVCESRISKFAEAIKTLEKACELDPCNAECFFCLGTAYSYVDGYNEAIKALTISLQINPSLVKGLNNLGIVFHKMQKYGQAIEVFNKAINLDPSYFQAHNNLGNTYRALGETSSAQMSYEAAVNINSEYTDGLYNLGIVSTDLGEIDRALAFYRKVIGLDPGYASAYNNMGVLYHVHLKKADVAISYFKKAISANQSSTEFHFNLGNALRDAGYLSDACRAFQECFAHSPTHVDALNNLGLCQKDLGLFNAAESSFKQALELSPGYFKGLNNLGVLYRALRRQSEALTAYTDALNLKADFVDALVNRGNLYKESQRSALAIRDYESAYTVEPDRAYLQGTLLHAKMMVCDWSGYDEALDQLTMLDEVGRMPSTPFPPLALIDDSSVHLELTKRYCEREFSHLLPEAIDVTPFKSHPKIRIGYFSADFYEHATSFLVAELLESHNRQEFEIFGFSFGPMVNDQMATRINSSFDKVFDVSLMSDYDVVALCRTNAIEIAIDLKGYTADARPGIFKLRAAPVQVNYLGFPGSMGGDFMDYIVADPSIIHPEDYPKYAESVALVQTCYQANDSKLGFTFPKSTRMEAGLPSDKFVFCSFNNNYKITPQVFSTWCEVLNLCPESVLWIYADSAVASDNLRREAAMRGIERDRIIFAPKASHREHLARQALADLMLDTFPYTAHTTASDALRVGLPIVTRIGKSFASRVCGSLLMRASLSPLIAHDIDSYKQIAIRCYRDRDWFASIRDGLLDRREELDIFSGRTFCLHFEDLLSQMSRRLRAGDSPCNLISHPSPSDGNSHAFETSGETGIPLLPSSVDHSSGTVMHVRELFNLLDLHEPLSVVDVGAAYINEEPSYSQLVDHGLAHLHAFEGDPRQRSSLLKRYGAHMSLHDTFLGDGSPATLHIASAESGMTSLLEPSPETCSFFNGFMSFAKILERKSVKTTRLDDFSLKPSFVKLDTQGSELKILQHGSSTLQSCSAIQLEVSFICLYKGQPSLGMVDSYLRSAGFLPHCFVDIKAWSISPVLRDNDFRKPFKQLLEADVIYVRDPVSFSGYNERMIKNLIVIALVILKSPDLAIRATLRLEEQGVLRVGVHQELLKFYST